MGKPGQLNPGHSRLIPERRVDEERDHSCGKRTEQDRRHARRSSVASYQTPGCSSLRLFLARKELIIELTELTRPARGGGFSARNPVHTRSQCS